MSKLVYLVPLFPLLGFLVNGLLRKSLSKSMIGIIGSGAMLASFVVSLLIFFDVKNGGGATVQLFNFIHVGTLSYSFRIFSGSIVITLLTYYYGHWIFNSFVFDCLYARRRTDAFWQVFCLFKFICVFDVVTRIRRQLCGDVYWLGRCRPLFLLTHWILV